MPNALIQPHELASLNRLDAEIAIRDHARAVYLGDSTAIVRILGLYKLFVDTRDEGFGAHLLLDGFWEIWLTLFCARNLRTGMVAIDVGANCGYYSVMFAEIVGPSGHVLAIEPNGRACDLLQRSLNLNGFGQRTTVRQVALGDIDHGDLSLYVPHTEPKNAVVVAPDFTADPSQGAIVSVQASTLDHLCGELGRVDFIKIDAEGSEARIFAGMRTLVARCRPMIVMEVNIARYNDPAGFLQKLASIYGELYQIGFDGKAHPVSLATLLEERVGEDWLILLSPQQPL